MESFGSFDYLARFGLCALPVLAFLLGLKFLDTYKLLTLRRILTAVLVGCGTAVACYLINTLVFRVQHPGNYWYGLFGAPVLEELFKAAYIIYLIRRSRVGFMVDAAICGFAVGAGFALAENAVYLLSRADSSLLLWALRGFVTAMMHGGTTAIVGIVSSSLMERRGPNGWRVFVPGTVIAILIHAFFNLPFLPPLASTLGILIGLPVILVLIFLQRELSLQQWLGDKLDKDLDALQMISTGHFAETKAGSYLRSLKSTFPPLVVGDMLCLLQLSLELGARAKGDLLKKWAGFPLTLDPSLPAKFKELAYLERSIGRAGKLAIAPLLSLSSRDLWGFYNLGQDSKSASRRHSRSTLDYPFGL